MSTFVNQVKKMLVNTKSWSFKDLSRLLKNFGFEESNKGGSHYVFRKKGEKPITIPKHKPVGQVYAKNVIKRLNLEVWYEENK